MQGLALKDPKGSEPLLPSPPKDCPQQSEVQDKILSQEEITDSLDNCQIVSDSLDAF
jgi:hypothetical protein